MPQAAQDDTTAVRLKDGTVLRLKGKNLSPDEVSDRIAAYRAQSVGSVGYKFPAPAPPDTTIRGRTWRDDLRDVVAKGKEALPAAGATAAVALTPETGGLSGLLYPVLAAALGGAAGESAREGVASAAKLPDRPKSWWDVVKGLSGAGAEQATWEAGGRAIEGVAGRAIGAPSREITRPEDRAVKAISDKYGLGLTSAEVEPRGVRQITQKTAMTSMGGRGIMQAAKERTIATADRAVNDAMFSLHQPTSALSTGQGMQKALMDAKGIFAEQAKPLAQQVDQAAQGVLVNISPLKHEAQAAASMANRLPSQGFRNVGKLTPTEAKILEDFAAAPDYIMFSDATRLRSRLMAIAPQPEDLMPHEGPALARRFVGRLTEAVESAGGNLQGNAAVDSWKALRQYWREGAHIFDGGLVSKLIFEDPSKVVSNVKTASDMKAVHDALLGYGARYGTPAQQAASKEAWNMFRERYVRETLIGASQPRDIGLDALHRLSKNLKEAEPETLDTLFGGDVQGQRLRRTLTEISRAMERVDALPEPPAYRSLWMLAQQKILAPYEAVVAKALTNPDKAQKILKVLRTVGPRWGAAVVEVVTAPTDEDKSQ